jgi:predicted metal-dependent hydrolase
MTKIVEVTGGAYMSESLLYIAYYAKVPAQKSKPHARFVDRLQATQALSNHNKDTFDSKAHALSTAFIQAQIPKAQILDTFIETLLQRRPLQWPVLRKALQCCKERGATLLILELGKLANNQSFAQLLLGSDVPFFCADQPFVTAPILEALTKHAQVQKTLHGKLIREGLKMTTAKSGNPHAAEVIGRVNKPKIDTAILFAFLLEPIIKHYQEKKYSQRQMVKALNEEGFTAPEGGQWVLSQLQKVLDRILLNTIAYQCQDFMTECQNHFLNSTQIIEALREKGIASFKGATWDITQLKKLSDRIQQIDEMIIIHQFVIDLLPLLRDTAHQPALSNTALLNKCMHAPIVQKNLSAFPEGLQSLDAALESALKHLSIYLKIVKVHLEQLAKVLQLEAHHYTKMDSLDFPKPLKQIIQLFQTLEPSDMTRLENLALASLTWSGTKRGVETTQAV